jgi:hypothetical protein
MSSYKYKNTPLDQIVTTFTTNPVSYFKNIGVPINTNYSSSFNTVYIDEYARTDASFSYIYGPTKIDLAKIAIAMYAESTGTTFVSIPSWCNKIRAILVGGGGGGSTGQTAIHDTTYFDVRLETTYDVKRIDYYTTGGLTDGTTSDGYGGTDGGGCKTKCFPCDITCSPIKYHAINIHPGKYHPIQYFPAHDEKTPHPNTPVKHVKGATHARTGGTGGSGGQFVYINLIDVTTNRNVTVSLGSGGTTAGNGTATTLTISPSIIYAAAGGQASGGSTNIFPSSYNTALAYTHNVKGSSGSGGSTGTAGSSAEASGGSGGSSGFISSPINYTNSPTIATYGAGGPGSSSPGSNINSNPVAGSAGNSGYYRIYFLTA